MTNIRTIAKKSVFLSLAVGASSCIAAKKASLPAKNKPNIIFILTDDQRWNTLSCMNHPFVQTPNMDRIAKEGARFTNAFVTCSLCSPSRASFLTGVYPHIHGVRNNTCGKDPDPDLPNMGQLFQKEGYKTAFIGKWHMKSHSQPRKGFDYWLSFKGQGVYNNPKLNENGRVFKKQGYTTDILTDYAVQWLRPPKKKPFLLYLSHKAVHAQFTPAERHKQMYINARLPEPPNWNNTLEGKPEWQRAAWVRGVAQKQWNKNRDKKVPKSLWSRKWNPWRNKKHRNYYQTLAAVDEGIGRIFDVLKKMGELDNTVIIFASDNGFNIFPNNNRIRADKRTAHEDSMRIPFILRYPKLVKSGTKLDEMILNIDLLPSILDLAGAKIPSHIQGKSFKPLLEGKKVKWRKSFLYEYFLEEKVPGVPAVLAVRTNGWKYMTYPDIKKKTEPYSTIKDMDELYDLKNDPYELKNLAEVPAYHDKVKEMQVELVRLKKEFIR